MATVPHDESSSSPLQSRQRTRRTAIAWRGLALLLATAVIGPWLLLALAFWAADGAWEFEGRNLRYWMFVRGSRLERLGTVGETHAPVSYSVSLQEGTFPGWSIASYESREPPAAIVATYADRCRAMRLKVTEQTVKPIAGGERAELTCEIELYLDVEILAESAAGGSRVHLKVWGSK